MEREPVSSVRAAWQVLWTSRAVVWAAGLLGLLWLGEAPNADQFDPGALTRPFSPFGDLLVAPAARWDAVWYLSIAQGGYADSADGAKAAFYPLYPLLTKGVGWVVGSTLAAGLLISLVSFFGALVLLHKLATLELGERGGATRCCSSPSSRPPSSSRPSTPSRSSCCCRSRRCWRRGGACGCGPGSPPRWRR